MRSVLGGIRNAVQSPVPYAPRGAGRSSNWFGTGRRVGSQEQQMAAMGEVGTLFQIVTRLANGLSQAEWNLWTNPPSGQDEDRTLIPPSANLAAKIWAKPNPFMPGQEFRETVQQHVELVGEGWMVVAKAQAGPFGGIPQEIWPVRPDRMEPVPSATEFISGYVYTSPDGERIPLDVDEVIFLRMPNPLDPYRGLGAVQSILVDLDSTRYSAEWNRSFFRNSAQPGGIIEIDKRLQQEEFDELRQRWNDQHRGVSKAHRVAILEQGKWVDRKYSMADMQFVELRSVGREVIREAFGIHGHMIGLSTDINRANAEAAELVFAKWHMVPRLERWKAALNWDFLPMFGESTGDAYQFDYESPVEEDATAIRQARDSQGLFVSRMARVGYDPGDVLEAAGLPPMRYVGPPATPSSATENTSDNDGGGAGAPGSES